MYEKEAGVSKRPLPLGVPAPMKASPWSLDSWKLPFSTNPKSSPFNAEGFPSRLRIPSATSSVGISSADQGSSDKQGDQSGVYIPSFLQKPYGFWSKEMILEQLKEYAEENESLDLMQLKAPHLYVAVNTKFGNLKSATKEVNREYQELIPKTKWSKERVIRDIQQLHEMGEDLSDTHIQNIEPSLIGAAPKYFGSWKGAIKAAGFDYDKIRRDWIFESFQESKFEEYAEKVLDKIGLKVKPQNTIKIGNQSYQPNFYDPNTGSWIDAKLDAGSHATHLTIQKYLPFTERIMIIYLKGEPRKEDTDYAQFVHISQFYEILSNTGSDDLIKKIESLNDRQLRPELKKDLNDFIDKKHPADKNSVERIIDHFSI